MEQLMWAFGSMLFVGLIISFLPIGLSKSGKIITVLTGLLLALGGIAATVSFSLLQTILLFVALIFFVSYILDNRFRKIIYSENNSLIDKILFEKHEWPEAETLILEEVTQVELPTVSLQKADSSEELSNLSFENQQEMDEDIALLLNRDLNLAEVEKVIEIVESDRDYLTEIEDLLEARMEDEQAMMGHEDELAITGMEEQIDHETDLPELILTSKGAE